MTKRRLIVAIVILAVAVALGGLALWVEHRRAAESDAMVVDIGGPFDMVAHDGRRVTEQDLLGHPSIVFFGFTHCPDVCPMTLAEIAAWLDTLGADGERLEAYFVTVDPERDTPEVLARYVGYFSPRITGLTGTDAQVAAMAGSYRVYYRKVDLDDGDYVMDHTAAVYLMDSEGRFADAITFQASTEEALAKLRRLIAGS